MTDIILSLIGISFLLTILILFYIYKSNKKINTRLNILAKSNTNTIPKSYEEVINNLVDMIDLEIKLTIGNIIDAISYSKKRIDDDAVADISESVASLILIRMSKTHRKELELYIDDSMIEQFVTRITLERVNEKALQINTKRLRK